MSYFRICPNCGKGTIGRYATDDSLCGECSDNSGTTDKLSVEKLQEIRVEELKDFNSKILQAELKNQKLQEQLNTAKKALKNIYIQPEDDGIISIEEYPSQIRYYAQDALAAIGGDDDENRV